MLELILKMNMVLQDCILHIASKVGCKEIVIALLNHGADITIMTENSYTDDSDDD